MILVLIGHRMQTNQKQEADDERFKTIEWFIWNFQKQGKHRDPGHRSSRNQEANEKKSSTELIKERGS